MVAPIERSVRIGGFVAIALLASLVLAATASAAVRSGQGGLSPVVAQPPPAAVPGSTGSAATATGTTVFKPFFPVRGPHEYWDGFGAGRGHQGADIGAACGTPLVAVSAGEVTMVKYHSRAGHYLVLDVEGVDLDFAYMHLARASHLRPGESVVGGQVIGSVGATGNASGCHLHFEIWEGTYYGGGSPIDPMPLLESWDRQRKRQRLKAQARR